MFYVYLAGIRMDLLKGGYPMDTDLLFQPLKDLNAMLCTLHYGFISNTEFILKQIGAITTIYDYINILSLGI
jgi:hypothetical protein